MSDQLPPSDYDRLRGWSLAALYAAFALLSVLLIFAAFRFWPATKDAELEVFAVALTGAATVVSGSRTALEFARLLRAGKPVPHMVLTPFVFITLTLIAASSLFHAL